MEKREIKKLPDKIYKCNSFIEFKSELFKMTQEKHGVKTTTGITKDIKELFTKEDLIEILNNFKNKNEKKEIIRLLDFKELTFEDVAKIFKSDELTEVIKEFNIKVSEKEIEELYSVTEGKDKELLQSLLNMDITDERTITEIVLENAKEESVINYIREYNLKLTNEQLNDIITRFEDKNISDENRIFINTVASLSSRNVELASTINYKVVGEKYQGLQRFLPFITYYPEMQEQILNLSDKEYTVFSACLDFYSDKTQDWVPVIVGILDNIKQYEELTDNLDVKEIQREGKVELLTKLLSEPNYFNITNVDEYFKKRDMLCEVILKDPNSEDLEKFPLISEMSEKDKIKFAVLEKNFGLSLEQAQVLISKFGDDIVSIENLGENAEYYKEIINSLKFICDDKNINEIANITFDKYVKFLDANIVEREIKDIYDKDYVSQLYRPIEDDFEREEDGVLIYKAGKSTDGKFLMETHSPGVVYANVDLRKGNFKSVWNKPKVKSQAFCTVTSRQDMLIATNIPFLEYGFYDFEEGSLRASGYEDISSEAKTPVIFADEDEKYCNVDNKINKTRNINENNRSRIQADGTRKQPDYIKFRKSRFISPQKAQEIWENSKKAAKQFGIPIVIVDQDECTKRENEELQRMLQEFSETKNPVLISKIIVKFENNRKGNDWGKDGEGNSINTDFEIAGQSSTITRDSMLLSLITTIKLCDKEKGTQLYKILKIAIEDEVKKMKKPGPKVLNEKGIPVVTKKQMTMEEYFSTGRNKETGEFIKILAYDKFVELGKKILELNFEDKEIVNKFNEYIKSTKLIKESMMHGINHTKHVILYSKMLANAEGITEKQSQLLLIAAMFHDVGRGGKDGDNKHAEMSADIFKQHTQKNNNLINGINLSDDEIKIIQIAIRYHEYSDRELQGELDEQELKRLCIEYSIDWRLNKESIKIVSLLLKDADALDRTRFLSSRQALDRQALRSNTAKRQEMIEYSRDVNKELAIEILRDKGIEVLENQNPLEVLVHTMKNSFPITEGFLGATKRISESENAANLTSGQREIKDNYSEYENPNRGWDNKNLED